jgi:hypothetical protein
MNMDMMTMAHFDHIANLQPQALSKSATKTVCIAAPNQAVVDQTSIDQSAGVQGTLPQSRAPSVAFTYGKQPSY